jgi:hypothetical protein
MRPSVGLYDVRRHQLAPNQFVLIGKALVLTFVLGACAQARVANDGGTEERAEGKFAPCSYDGNHDIYERLKCLRVRLEGMMPPNNRLVSDASASARRASYSAPQSER